MGERHTQPLLDGTTIQLFDVWCRAPASAPAEEEHTVTTQVVLPLRGCFEVRRGHDVAVADPTSVVAFRAGDDYRVGHPTDGGDDCLVFALPPRAAGDVTGSADNVGIVAPTVRLGAHRLRAALRHGILLEGTEADGTLDRWAFTDIQPESFTWTGYESKDEGATWPMIERMLVRRRR